MKQETKFKDTEIGLIPEDLEETTLGSVVTFQRGYDLPLKDRKEGPYPIIMSNGIGGNHNEFKVKGPGITIGRSGNLGQPFYTEKDYWPHNTTLYVKKFENSNPKFMYYFLKRLKLNRFNAGSAVPTLNRNHIHPILIIIPRKIEEQKAIAKNLSDLDLKIELLQKQNKTLEAIGQAIFKHWFVDFEFPNEQGKPYKSSGGEMVFNEEMGKKIPKGWEVGNYKEIVSVSTGKGLKRDDFVDNGKYSVLGANGELGRTDNYLFNERLILTGRVGTLGTVYLVNDKVWISDNVLISQPLSEENYYFAYFTIKRFDFQSLNRGSTQPLITQTDLKNQDIIIPDSRILKEFHHIICSLFNKIDSNKLQIQSLKKTRDSLLPKLMSGKIRVLNNQKIKEAV